MKNKSLDFVFEYVLPVLLLIYFLVNATYYLAVRPYTGLQIHSNGTVYYMDVSPSANSLQVGDTIISIDGQIYSDFSNNLDNPPLWRGNRQGEQIQMTVVRDGKELQTTYTLPSDITPLLISRLISQWFMPFLFYFAGLIGLFFLRPRGIQRNLFVLFNFLIATWFSASVLSSNHELGSHFVLRAAFWLWMPVAWHFHWVFPRPLARLPAWLGPVIYSASILLVLAQVLQWLPAETYLISFLLAILGSIGLLAAHIFRQPDFRRLAWQVRNLFFFLIIPVGASTAFSLVLPVEQRHFTQPLNLLGLSALPGFYFFILFFQNKLTSNRQVQRLFRLYTWVTLTGILSGVLYAIVVPFFPNTSALFANYFILVIIGLMFVNFIPLLILPALSSPTAQAGEDEQLQIRANRLASSAIFLFLILLLGGSLGFVVMIVLPIPFNFVAPLLAALVVAITTLLGYNHFQRWFDRRVLNIPLQPEKLLETYSERILTALDEATLRNLFTQEVLPSWLMRQFALLKIEDGRLLPFITFGLNPEQIPDNPDALPEWARLALPLTLEGKPAGLMLFGRRDPDDFYAANETAVLRQIANMTAMALANIKQSAALLELYRTDIERQETERTAIAAELHDDVLQHMAILSSQLGDLDAGAEALETYQYTTDRIRTITSGLRTPLLAFGLVSALEGMLDQAQERGLKGISFVFAVSGSDARLDEHAELHLYRLAQQALDNALQHARASEIRLSGSVTEKTADLTVSDNGVGFASGEKLDISGLLANKHFGLAGMFERAALIGAEMTIESQPGKGCRVNVRWAAK